jgi:putative tryptophan/tyrosine transport system substrate-binding protein
MSLSSVKSETALRSRLFSSSRSNVVQAATARDIDTAFASLVQQGTGALIVANDPSFVSRRDQIVALAARHMIPTMYFSREFTAAGGLLSYGASLIDAARQGGIYTGKILKGDKPADLPVVQPTKFELVITLKHTEARRRNIPTAEYQSVLEKEQQSPKKAVHALQRLLRKR